MTPMNEMGMFLTQVSNQWDHFLPFSKTCIKLSSSHSSKMSTSSIHPSTSKDDKVPLGPDKWNVTCSVVYSLPAPFVIIISHHEGNQRPFSSCFDDPLKLKLSLSPFCSVSTFLRDILVSDAGHNPPAPLSRFCMWRRILMIPRGHDHHRMKGRRNWLSTSTLPKTTTEEDKSSSSSSSSFFNPCGIQMISDKLFSQIFPGVERQKDFPPELVDKCRRHLESHGLWWGQKVKGVEMKEVEFTLPPLEGKDIDEHFRNIAIRQTKKYRELLEELVSVERMEMPTEWEFQVGWTKYYTDGRRENVPYPEEDALVFDIEVCMSEGQLPTLACAVSPSHWYSWCSSSLVSGVSRDLGGKHRLHELIPLETLEGDCNPPFGEWREKIVVGHNVSYDRARVKEQYFLEKTKLRFLDTMSLHIAVSGITSFQRALKMTMKSREKNGGPKTISGTDVSALDWDELSSLNNLADVYKLYCTGPEIKKDERNVFVKGTLTDVRQNFQSLMSYCSRDVVATYEVLQCLLPSFFERFPHPVTFCGTLEMGSTYLPVNQNWIKYMENADRTYRQSEQEMKSILMKKADDALKFLKDERYKKDPWLWDLDWKVTKKRISKKTANKTTQSQSDEPVYPAWYKKLMYKPGDPEYQPGPGKISSSMQCVPKLLRLSWFGFPLHHSKTGKWGFLIKRTSNGSRTKGKSNHLAAMDEEQSEEDDADGDAEIWNESAFPYQEWEAIYEDSKAKLILQGAEGAASTDLQMVKEELKYKSEEAAQDLSDFLKGLEAVTGRSFMLNYPTDPKFGQKNSPHPLCEFVPLPHKNGAQYRVGNPLSKDFLSKIEEGVLSCMNGQDVANKVVKISKQGSYWRNSRDRIFGQMTVWFEGKDIEAETGAIIPQVVVAGTLTRRAVEPTWMTASNAYLDRIGSELKGMVQAPPSYNFVGADVDSQELWIASVIGDAHFAGQHGSTALGWMTLQGSKSAGTDMHSKTASVSGIARDHAKVLNYARIYGAGMRFAERLLLQFNRNMKPNEAKQKAKAMYEMTKGEKKFLLNEEGKHLANHLEEFQDRLDEPFSKLELVRAMSYHFFPYREYMTLVDKTVWDSGTESFMFNRLEEIAQQENPRTPVLGGMISRSLVPSVVRDDYMTSRVNWVVQSSAVDYLHLMLTCMGWLISKYNLNARFSLSVHDEVRYLVHSEDKHRVALALQITNLLTRAFCSYRLNMLDLPQSVAFFSCVDVDKVIRKEVTDDCNTPSNPKGLKETYNIPRGEALDISKVLEITGGSLLKEMDNDRMNHSNE